RSMALSRWRSSSSVTVSFVMGRRLLAVDTLSIGVAPGSQASGASGSRALPDRDSVAALLGRLVRERVHAQFVLGRIVLEGPSVARMSRDLRVRLYEGATPVRGDPLATDLVAEPHQALKRSTVP